MPLQPVPWATGNGADNPVEGARLALYAATKGARGVAGPGDMRVTALPVPGGAVRVHTGGSVTPNDYIPGGGGQAYAMREESHTDVPVPATGSGGGSTRYLVARVSDPQYAGPEPDDPVNGPYNSYALVGSEHGHAFPYVPLAKIVQPANTATITNAMITDVRTLAQPREKSFIYSNPTIVATEETLTSTLEKGELFPNIGSITAPIPEWATRVQIEAEWLQVSQPAGDFNGRIWVEWGPYVEQSVRTYKTQAFAVNGNGSNNVDRSYWKVAQEVGVPPAMRGTRQIFFMKGRLLSSSNNAARPRLDSASGLVLKLRFLEVPDDFEVNA